MDHYELQLYRLNHIYDSAIQRFSDTQNVPVDGFAGAENWALDAVTVTQTSQGSGVPEPSTFALAAGAATLRSVLSLALC